MQGMILLIKGQFELVLHPLAFCTKLIHGTRHDYS